MATHTTDTVRSISIGPLPASTKVYLPGRLHPGVRVAMRDIALAPSANEAPVRVYDSSGPYTDPSQTIDVERGLPALCAPWIEGRGDVTAYNGRRVRPEDNGLKAGEIANMAVFPGGARAPLRAGGSGAVTQLSYARRGMITPEMEYVAIRENLGREQAAAPTDGESFGADIPAYVTPEFVRDEIARGRAIIPANINHPESEPKSIFSKMGISRQSDLSRLLTRLALTKKEPE